MQTWMGWIRSVVAYLSLFAGSRAGRCWQLTVTYDGSRIAGAFKGMERTTTETRDEVEEIV